LRIGIVAKARTWLLIGLLCCTSLGLAQEKNPEQDPKNPEPTTNVEESIEALFGPDEKEETTEEKPAGSQEPILYIADTDNGRIVVMQGLDGEGFTAVGMPGFGFGRFLRPAQVWVDFKRRLYVADSGNNRVIRLDQTSQQGWTEIDDLSSPMGVAVDKSGVYIADTKADRVLLVEEVVEGAEIKEVLTPPTEGEKQLMSRPTTLWIDKEGALYICCGEDPPGGRIFKTWKEKDRRRWKMFEGEGLAGSRFRPSSVVTIGGTLRLLDESGQRIVTMQDMEGKRMKELNFRDDHRFRLSRPGGLAVDESGKRFFIADSGNDRILEVRADGSIVREFTHMDDDPNSVLRNPTSIFVFSPAPGPEPESEEEEEEE